MGSNERRKSSESFAESHGRILKELVPSSGLELPENCGKLEGTTGLRIEVFDLDCVGGADLPGAVAKVYPNLEGVFDNRIVLKMPGDGRHPYFANGGEEGKQTVIWETEVDQRVLKKNIFSGSLGLGWFENGRLFREEKHGRIPAMVMPYYDEDTDFGWMIQHMGRSEKRTVMEQAVETLFAFERDMDPEDAKYYAGMGGLKLIFSETFLRALSWYKDKPLSTDDTLETVIADVEDPYIQSVAQKCLYTSRELMSDAGFGEFIREESRDGGFVDSHGDPRPYDNASIIETESGLQFVMRDPVRLFRRDIQDWTDFGLTHRIWQLALLIAGLNAHGELGAAGDAMLHYFSKVKQREFSVGDLYTELSKEEQRMVGIGMCYGAFVEILVGNGCKRDTGAYWRAIDKISKNGFLGW